MKTHTHIHEREAGREGGKETVNVPVMFHLTKERPRILFRFHVAFLQWFAVSFLAFSHIGSESRHPVADFCLCH